MHHHLIGVDGAATGYVAGSKRVQSGKGVGTELDASTGSPSRGDAPKTCPKLRRASAEAMSAKANSGGREDEFAFMDVSVLNVTMLIVSLLRISVLTICTPDIRDSPTTKKA